VNIQLAGELQKLEQEMNVQLKSEELKEAELRMDVSICEVEWGEVLGEDEDWGHVEDLMNYCEDSRQQEVYFAKEGIIDDFLNS